MSIDYRMVKCFESLLNRFYKMLAGESVTQALFCTTISWKELHMSCSVTLPKCMHNRNRGKLTGEVSLGVQTNQLGDLQAMWTTLQMLKVTSKRNLCMQGSHKNLWYHHMKVLTEFYTWNSLFFKQVFIIITIHLQ